MLARSSADVVSSLAGWTPLKSLTPGALSSGPLNGASSPRTRFPLCLRLLRTAATVTALSSSEPSMEEVHEEPLFVPRVAGLDIAKAGVEGTIRVPSDTSPGRRQQDTRTFGTTRRQRL